MDGIKMADCRFYVNKDERVIVCVIPNTKYKLDEFLEHNFRYSDYDLYGITWADDWLMPDSFTGKAVCSEDDEWDEELGRMIAFMRAKHKFYLSFFKRANHIVNGIDRRLNQMITTFNDLGYKVAQKQDALERKIKEKSGEA